MTTSDEIISQIWRQIQRYQQTINTAVVALLVIYLIVLVADFTWRLLPEPNAEPASSQARSDASSQNASSQNSVNISGVQNLNLFGSANEKPKKVEPIVQDAPQTQLNLRLTGVVASSLVEAGAAIVDYRGQQATYGIGENIEGTRASIHEVLVDRIIIRNGSRFETLMLDGVEFNKLARNQIVGSQRAEEEDSGPPSLKSLNLKNVNSPVSSEQLANLRAKPERFLDFIKITPMRDGGDLTGYRVNPGKNTSLFANSGLRDNDVVTEINGLDLTDVGQAMQAMEVLRNSKKMELTVLRDGVEEDLYLTLPESEEE
ncbi:type II secretion system protein GspC [Alteromonas sp. a30]|uniref:type II secretion system protein GspC n=1 Tax=Alteromonas sp. a30 TaxID=2730917 RepID=UPI002280537A|nr:type II secretion system protein GspC [Alteromonas sp. a30]MCY7295673.1 type II secretion system protein GspC [Alteromonas sp. a30]